MVLIDQKFINRDHYNYDDTFINNITETYNSMSSSGKYKDIEIRYNADMTKAVIIGYYESVPVPKRLYE